MHASTVDEFRTRLRHDLVQRLREVKTRYDPGHASHINQNIKPLPSKGAWAMSVEQNKAIVRRYIEVGWSTGDMSAVEEAVAPDYRRHQPNMVMPVESEKELEQLIAMYRAGIPDLDIKIQHIVAEGDWVVTRVICQGTHTGELAGIAPSGKHLDFTASDIFQMVNGQIVESWHNVDDLGLLQQLGVIPALG